jgi:hypothetical protein
MPNTRSLLDLLRIEARVDPVAGSSRRVACATQGQEEGVVRSIVTCLALLAVLAAGCTSEQGRFTVISTKNVDFGRVDTRRDVVERQRSESDGRLWILFIPFGRAPTVAKTVDNCLEEGKGDFLVNAQVTSFWWTLLLVSWESYTTTADVAAVGAGAGHAPEPSSAPAR